MATMAASQRPWRNCTHDGIRNAAIPHASLSSGSRLPSRSVMYRKVASFQCLDKHATITPRRITALRNLRHTGVECFKPSGWITFRESDRCSHLQCHASQGVSTAEEFAFQGNALGDEQKGNFPAWTFFSENLEAMCKFWIESIRPTLCRLLSVFIIASALMLSIGTRSASAVATQSNHSIPNSSHSVTSTIPPATSTTEKKGSGVETIDSKAIDPSENNVASPLEEPILAEDEEFEKFEKELEQLISKPLPITVPFRVVSVRGSVPPIWVKDFIATQGKHSKMKMESVALQSSIMDELQKEIGMKKEKLGSNPTMAADLITINDSWLSIAIKNGFVAPMNQSRCAEWLRSLPPSWQHILLRDKNGKIDPRGQVYAIPYRWGCTLIAFRKDTFEKKRIPEIKDWNDLWRKEFRGKISFVNCPREIVGCVLKSLGSGYNVSSFKNDVKGGSEAVEQKFIELQKQIKLIDSKYYLKALENDEVWIAVGWSSDILPAAAKSSTLKFVIPESGTSLWADLWALPDAKRIQTEKIGGRFRGPSPLTSQWIDFCLQRARSKDFGRESWVGFCPFELPDLKNNNPSFATSAVSIVSAPTATADNDSHHQAPSNVNLPASVSAEEVEPSKDLNSERSLSLVVDKQGTENELQKNPFSLQFLSQKNLRTRMDESLCSSASMAKSEFIEPLSEENVEEYKTLFSSLKKSKENVIGVMASDVMSSIETMKGKILWGLGERKG